MKPSAQPLNRLRLLSLFAAFLSSAYLLQGCAAQSGSISDSSNGQPQPQARNALFPPASKLVSYKIITSKDVPNFHIVEPFLLRGGAPNLRGFQELKKIGVKTVIDLRIAPKHVAAERKMALSLGMTYINLPMSADPPTPKQIDTFLTTSRNPSDQKVYVHCQYGADRTGCMVGIYREKFDGWAYPRTYAEMRRYGFKRYLHKLANTVRKFAPVEKGKR